ncbi:nucleoside deaminase [Pseudovibrio sp. SCP19]|uniref:nucleoside deaminase n=1 Tax=Pseudovibrio sp. SCP19 TaxID=3141374 RepID=UPI00333BCCC2
MSGIFIWGNETRLEHMDNELATHQKRMQALVEYTATSFETPYPTPFGGALYGSDGTLLAQAYNRMVRECDPSSHGELNAIREACQKYKTRSFPGSILYATSEPCPMCMTATISIGVETLVFGAFTNEDAINFWPQEMDLRARDIAEHVIMRPKIEIIEGVERDACRQLFTDCASTMIKLGIRI